MDEAENLQEELGRFLSQPRLANVTDTQGRRWLSIPGHTPHIVRAYQNKKRRFLSARSNTEFYEEPATMVFSILLSFLEPAVVFDIGAGQGHFSFVAASHTAAHPNVFAFDMRPGGIEAIQRRAHQLEWTDRVHAHLCGLSDKHIGLTRVWSARMKLFESKPREDEYREAIWRRLKFFLRGDKRRGLLAVDLTLTTLDRFCADHNVAPGLIKIDVDGYEGKILRGATTMLRTAKPTILLELHQDELQRDGITRTMVADILFDAGYSALFMTDHHAREPCRFVPVAPGHPLLARQETDMVIFYPPQN